MNAITSVYGYYWWLLYYVIKGLLRKKDSFGKEPRRNRIIADENQILNLF